jgi:MOSC domain-containing protein YiiM
MPATPPSATIEQVLQGAVHTHHDGERSFTTAIAKEPVEGPVAVGPSGIDGDAQADRKHHGGPDKALLAYAASHYPAWRAEHGLDLRVGTFGENLSIVGQDEDHVCVGDTYRAGDLVAQVTQPREPCWKLAKRWGIPELPELTNLTAWTGWYLRVLTPATLAPATTIELVERPHPEWTVTRATRTALAGDAHDRRALAELPELAAVWHTMLHARADRAERTPRAS